MRISDWSSDVCSSDLELAKAGDETVPTIAKGHGVAPCDPDQHGKRRYGTDLRHGRKHILGASKSSIKERKARQDHHKDEEGGNNHPSNITLVRHRRCGCTFLSPYWHCGERRNADRPDPDNAILDNHLEYIGRTSS